MADELKPCPFCGGVATLYSVSFPIGADCADIHVSCGECDAIGPTVLFDCDHHHECDLVELDREAITAWNTRAPDPRIETLEAGIERALRCTPTVRDGAIIYDCGDPWEQLRQALGDGYRGGKG